MLSDEEQAAFLASVERVQRLAVHHLSGNREAAVSFIPNLHRGVDTVVQQAVDRGAKVDCKAGCAYCCSVRVEATEPEIFRIARAIHSRPVSEVNDIIERLRRYIATTEADPARARRINCAFLENNLCTIYEVRPATCRKAHSLSVKSCEDFAPEIPQSLEIILGAEALMKGTSEAYREVNLHSAAHELGRAVLMAITDEAAERRWHNGDEEFPERQV